ncbi:MAG: phage portal protein [Sphaerospermopsis sp.]|nr:phage portal protein [Sphaerospermopsis sp.]
MNLELRTDKVFEVKRGLIPRIKSALWGADSLNIQQMFIQELMESQISQNTFQFLTGSHSFNRKSLDYLIEYGYTQNPIVFGIINSILFKQENIQYLPYWKGKPYKSKTFDLDANKAFFNILTTGTVVFWDRETIGFGKQLEVIDTVNLQENYFRGFHYKYLERGIWYNIPEEDLYFVTFLDNPCKANGLTNFGLSPLQAAIMPVEALREMYTADTSLLKNKGSELLISNGDANVPLLQPENETFDEAMNKRIRGAKKFGRIATTTAKVEVHQLGRTIKELALWDGYKVKTRDICVALNYPSTLAGDTDASTLANYEQSLKSAYTGCVIPLAKKIFNNKRIQERLGYEVFIDTSSIDCLQEDQLKRSEKAKNNQTAIIELNAKVKDGTISKEIATNILITEWGYDQDEAAKMIMQEQSTNGNSLIL